MKRAPHTESLAPLLASARARDLAPLCPSKTIVVRLAMPVTEHSKAFSRPAPDTQRPAAPVAGSGRFPHRFFPRGHSAFTAADNGRDCVTPIGRLVRWDRAAARPWTSALQGSRLPSDGLPSRFSPLVQGKWFGWRVAPLWKIVEHRPNLRYAWTSRRCLKKCIAKSPGWGLGNGGKARSCCSVDSDLTLFGHSVRSGRLRAQSR